MMTYTYLNLSDIGPRFKETPVGTDEGNAAMGELLQVYAECGI